jgi:hypothetical protein
MVVRPARVEISAGLATAPLLRAAEREDHLFALDSLRVFSVATMSAVAPLLGRHMLGSGAYVTIQAVCRRPT